eukprot:Tamp_20105.p2 GENE.Tamp_20105~~Tamp_20105.p2  ORF type:complete len:163 (-),score=5.05 Tamp_20105:384-872(-)
MLARQLHRCLQLRVHTVLTAPLLAITLAISHNIVVLLLLAPVALLVPVLLLICVLLRILVTLVTFDIVLPILLVCVLLLRLLAPHTLRGRTRLLDPAARLQAWSRGASCHTSQVLWPHCQAVGRVKLHLPSPACGNKLLEHAELVVVGGGIQRVETDSVARH